MLIEEKKLHIIEEVLKINNDATLSALEDFMKKSNRGASLSKKSGYKEFSGIWSKEEADEIEKIIADSCENIHPDDWK
jgi:hypothetical protein